MAVDPRRFPRHLFVHSTLIVTCLAVGCATVAFRAIGTKPALAVGLATGSGTAATAAPATGAGPPTAPPTTPLSLDSALATQGYQLPAGADVYAVRMGAPGTAGGDQQFQAGGGALAENFWPASSIKVLAALGALDFVKTLGYTGAASVTFDDGEPTQTIRSIYERAVRDSANDAYDLLLWIAGVDRLNSQFLTAAHGFPGTSITRAYDSTELSQSPAMILEENGRRTYVPARANVLPPECPAGNCSNLFEMTESVRRVVLNDALPPQQRLNLDPADLKNLTQALLDAEGFFDPAVTAVFGPGARLYDKPGDVADLDCLDVALIVTASGARYLLAATVPHASGGCDALVDLATRVLKLVSG